jgi:hypothetical protein
MTNSETIDRAGQCMARARRSGPILSSRGWSLFGSSSQRDSGFPRYAGCNPVFKKRDELHVTEMVVWNEQRPKTKVIHNPIPTRSASRLNYATSSGRWCLGFVGILEKF